MFYFFCNDTATTEIYTYLHTLSLHDALPISAERPPWGTYRSAGRTSRAPRRRGSPARRAASVPGWLRHAAAGPHRSEEHTSELQSLMRISYAVFCLKKKIIPFSKTCQN